MELRTDRYKLKKLFPDKTKKYAQMLHKKAGDIEFIRKGIPIDPKDITIKDGERAAIRLVTTPHLDRDGEILIPHGAILDDFRQSPTVLYGHDYKGLPIGSDQWIKQTKEGIIAKTIYAKHQFAEDVYQCVKGKHLRSNSVGFIPVEAVSPEEDKKAFAEYQEILEKDYGIEKEESGKARAIYTKWIMLEHSDVPVASNAQSLNLAVSKGELTIQSSRLKKDLEIEVVKDVEIEVIKGEGGVTIFGLPVVDSETGKPIKGEDMKDKEIEVTYTAKDDKGEIKKFKDTIKGKEIEIIKETNDKKEKEVKGEEKAKTGTEEEKETITKPETTENYHRIPVNPGCKVTATITISAKEGIKALYCGEVKKVHTYLFDVGKWTMAEAKKWVSEHKDFTEALEKAIKDYFTEGIAPEKEEYKEIIKQIVEQADKEIEMRFELAEETTEALVDEDDEEKQEKFNCECIKCGHKLTSEEHCDKIKCPKCGGKMRRAERPGPGKAVDTEEEKVTALGDQTVELKIMDIPELKEHLKGIQEQVTELKEGRVLSTKNRTLVKDVRDLIRNLDGKLTSLLDATEPTSREEERTTTVETEKQFVIEKDPEKTNQDIDLAKAMEKVLSGDNLKNLLSKSVDEAVDRVIKTRMGKVD